MGGELSLLTDRTQAPGRAGSWGSKTDLEPQRTQRTQRKRSRQARKPWTIGRTSAGKTGRSIRTHHLPSWQANGMFSLCPLCLVHSIFCRSMRPEGGSRRVPSHRSVLRHQFGPLVVLRVVVPLVTLDAEAPVELVLGEVGPGGLGVRDHHLEQPFGLGILLLGLGPWALAVLGVVDPTNLRSGVGCLLGPGRLLDHLFEHARYS